MTPDRTCETALLVVLALGFQAGRLSARPMTPGLHGRRRALGSLAGFFVGLLAGRDLMETDAGVAVLGVAGAEVGLNLVDFFFVAPTSQSDAPLSVPSAPSPMVGTEPSRPSGATPSVTVRRE